MNETDPSGLDTFWLWDGKVWGPVYVIPFAGDFYSDAWSLVFPKRSSAYLASPIHPNFNPDQTNRQALKAGDIIDSDTRDWHNQTTQALKSTLAKTSVEVAMVAGPIFTRAMLSNSRVIAKGPSIDKIDVLVEKFGGTRKGWVKKKGWDAAGREWHWYEHHGKGRVGVKPAGAPDPF